MHLPVAGGDPRHALDPMLGPPFFPITSQSLRGAWSFHALGEGRLEIEGFDVLVRAVPHPGGPTYGLRIHDGRTTVAYVPDHGPLALGPGPDGWGPYHEAVRTLAAGVDLLLHDAQFTDRGPGHQGDVRPLDGRLRRRPGRALRGRAAPPVPPRPLAHRRRRRRHRRPVARRADEGVRRDARRHDRPLMVRAPVRPIATGFFLVGSVDWLVEVALTTAVYERTGSTSWVAACVAMRFVPGIAVGPLAGVLADKMDRRLVIVGSCASRVVTLGLLATVAFAGGEPATLLVLAVLDSTLATPYRPAALALLPCAVGPADLAAATATVGRALQGTWIAGPAVGALAAGLVDPAVAFAVAAVALGGAAAIAQSVAPCPPVRSTDVARSPVEMLRDGVVALRQADGALALVGLAVIVELVFGFELVAHVEVAAERLGIGAAGAGWLTAFIGAGGILGGALAATRRPGRPRRRTGGGRRGRLRPLSGDVGLRSRHRGWRSGSCS